MLTPKTYSTDEALEELIPLLRNGQLIILAGSGISVPPPSSLPTWDGFVDKFIEFCDSIQGLVRLDPSHRYDDLINDAKARKRESLIQVASALRQKLVEVRDLTTSNVESLFSSWLGDQIRFAKPNPNHEAIVGTDYPYILTTNYDRLLEDYAIANRFDIGGRSFTFKESELLAGVLYNRESAIIHLHGDTRNMMLNDFVFTAEDYLRISREYRGFTLSLHSLLLNYSVLFVGYGGSDPHIEELFEEFRYLFRFSASPKLPKAYLLLKRGRVGAVLRQYKKKMRTVIIEIDEYSQTTAFLEQLRRAKPRSN